MPYDASVYKVMIASPGDVEQERQIIRDVVAEWNAIHSEDRGIVLLPVGWETHSNPLMGGRPQAIINKQVLVDCDLLIAAFWTRLGSPTGKAASGTVEEIQEHLASGKPAMLYFSSQPVRLDSVDGKQYDALKKFKVECFKSGLVEQYESLEEFRTKLARQLAQVVIRTGWGADTTPAIDLAASVGPVAQPLSDYARRMLLAATRPTNGTVSFVHYLGGTRVSTDTEKLYEGDDRREIARWKDAARQLCDQGLATDRPHKYGNTLEVTELGYQLAERTQSSERPPTESTS